MKKILSIALVVVLLAGIAVSGTMAYLTDTDSAVNVMTLGNVKVDLIERQRSEDGTKLEDFEQLKELTPLVGSAQGDKDKWGMPVASNYVDKIVNAKLGDKSSDAYVRILVAIPAALEGETANENALHWNFGNRFDAEGNSAYNNGEWKAEGNPFFDDFGTNYTKMAEGVEIDGVKYNVYDFTVQHVVKAGEETAAPMIGFYLDSKVNYDNDNECYIFETENGAVEIDYDFTDVKIPVMVQAVQAAGFDSAEAALTAGFGDIAAGYNPWAGDAVLPVVVEDDDGLIEALESGKDVIMTDDIKIDPANMSNAYGTTGINVKNGQTIDGGGNTLDIKGAGGTWDSGINTTGGLIKDITVTGSFRGIFINHNSTHSEPVVLENVTIDGTTYTISCDQGMNQTLTATGCTFNGWTSFAKTLGSAKFVDCSFGEGNGYAYCRPYAPTEFVGCEFEAGYRLDARAAVIFENCTIGGVALTADNLATLVVSNIANATVK